jgi:LuxR family transcriptional regulator, maltose regulon positive regulatory protein
LVRTALLPRVTAETAEAVTGVKNAIAYVEQTYRRRLFTDRMQGSPLSYQYHALFRAFLQTRAKAFLSASQRDELLKRAAAEFEKSGDVDNAFALFVEGNHWEEGERIFVGHAAVLIAQGRWKTLQEWHAALPGRGPDSNPWVAFWLGRAMTTVEPPAARQSLESAFHTFLARTDEKGQLLCGVGILESLYYQYDEFRVMDLWIERTAYHLERHFQFTSSEEELWVNSVFLLACSYRSPGHPMLRRCVSRVEELLPLPLDANLKITAATMLHFWAYTALDSHATQLATREARPILGSDQLTAQRAALYLGEEGYSHYMYGRYSRALACFDEADVITRRSGLPEVEARVNHLRGFCQRRAGLLNEAEATIGRLEQLPSPRHGIRVALLDLLRAYVAFDRGDVDRALELALPSQQIGEEAGHALACTLMLIINASILIASGRFEQAKESLDHASSQIKDSALEYQHGAITLMRAWLALRTGHHAQCELFMREMLTLSRTERERTCIKWYPKILSEVLVIALERDIEPEAARQLIRDCGVLPNGRASDKWPSPVKIYTLGQFNILLDDKPPVYSRKSPKRVLMLLKALVAFGSKDVPEERLVDALWPDLDGDAAHKALSALLHRLRALLVDADAIRQRGGKLSINPERCWVDVQALEQNLESSDSSGLAAAIHLYQGAFLPEEEHESWTLGMREKMRAKFVEAVRRYASILEQSSDYEQAAQCYARGIEIDDLIEPPTAACTGHPTGIRPLPLYAASLSIPADKLSPQGFESISNL